MENITAEHIISICTSIIVKLIVIILLLNILTASKYHCYIKSVKQMKASSLNPDRSEHSKNQKNDQKRKKRAQMTVCQQEELKAKEKIRKLQQKATKHQLSTIPIYYDDQLHNLSKGIETNLITTSNIVTSLPTTSTISQLGMSYIIQI